MLRYTRGGFCFSRGHWLEESAFYRLAVAELDAVYRLACFLSRNALDAEDLVQETFLRAIKSSATYTPADFGIRPWLFKILHNLISTRASKAQRDQALLVHLSHERTDEQTSFPTDANLDALNWENVDERLKSAIESLSLDHRTTFLLSAVEGLRYREIAEVTDSPLGTVMSRLYRARVMLAAQLSDLAAEQRIGKPSRGETT